jgi:RimJ/RimL family protein N-acetyltransferase
MIQNAVIRLTKMNSDDKLFYREIYTDSNLMQYICKALDDSAAEKYFNIALKLMTKTPTKSLMFVIKLLNSNTKIGIISLRWNQEDNKSAEIGVMILKKHQRKSYAHMAKNLLIQHSLQQFNVRQLVAICDKENLAANLANQKLGFSLDQEFLDKTDNKVKTKWIIESFAKLCGERKNKEKF